MRLYIDDIRPAPEGWIQARTVTDAIRFIAQFGEQITDISIDHDISYAVEVAGTQRPFPSPENFTGVARFIAEYYDARSIIEPPHVIIHTANPVGGKELEHILADFFPEVKPESSVNRLENEL